MDVPKEQGSTNAAKRDVEPRADMVEPRMFVGITPDEFEEQAHTEMHKRGRRNDKSQHVDLSAEEYTPEEVARMMGISLEVVMHAVWQGELKAEKQGRDVVCIQHADVTDWLRRRGPGV